MDERSQTLLVTGGAGFMGSAFIRYLLLKQGFKGQIVNLDALTYASNLELLSELKNDERYHFVRGDIRDSALLRNLQDRFHFNQIVHFAAETHVDRSIENPRLFFETNVLGTLELLELVRSEPTIRFHLISTDEVYGALGHEGVFTEESPYQPNSPYSASKASSDYLVRSYVQTYGIHATTSHACNNYGPGQYPEKLIPHMIYRACNGKPLPLYGDGEQIREWLFVDDHSRAVLAILEKGRIGEVYNISGSCEMTNISLLHTLLEKLAPKIGKDVHELKNLIQFVQDRPGHDFRYALEAKKIQSECGWKPTVSFEQGLEATIDWYLAQQLALKH